MRAVSAALVLLSGVLLFAAGFVPVAIVGEGRLKEYVAVVVPGAGALLALIGFIGWVCAFLRSDADGNFDRP
jgi:hypothetical protein